MDLVSEIKVYIYIYITLKSCVNCSVNIISTRHLCITFLSDMCTVSVSDS